MTETQDLINARWKRITDGVTLDALAAHDPLCGAFSCCVDCPLQGCDCDPRHYDTIADFQKVFQTTIEKKGFSVIYNEATKDEVASAVTVSIIECYESLSRAVTQAGGALPGLREMSAVELIALIAPNGIRFVHSNNDGGEV